MYGCVDVRFFVGKRSRSVRMFLSAPMATRGFIDDMVMGRVRVYFWEVAERRVSSFRGL